MFRFTIRDVLWLTVVVGLACGCSQDATLSRSNKGKQAIQQIQSADNVTLSAHIDGKDYACTLAPDAKKRLISWLGIAVRDKRPLKYEVTSSIAFSHSKDDWLVLQINDKEAGLRIDIDNYWRGLDRDEFAQIVRDCTEQE
jgi:hypothetical protein